MWKLEDMLEIFNYSSDFCGKRNLIKFVSRSVPVSFTERFNSQLNYSFDIK